MALRATIFKADVNVADADRHYYANHPLTVALHPSETDERMMIRLLAFALHAHEDLVFTRGLSDSDEPALWQKDLTGAIDLWIEVGQPDERRLNKACGRASQVVVYCYGHAIHPWWNGLRTRVERQRNLRVVSIPSESAKALAGMVSRTMSLHFHIEDGTVLVSGDKDSITVEPVVLK